MPTFNLALRSFGLEPKETREGGRTPCAPRRDDRATVDQWQSIQLSERRSCFAGGHWASFVVPPDGRTVFAGIDELGSPQPPASGSIAPFTGGLLDKLQRRETGPSRK